jgi:hypothetical protein
MDPFTDPELRNSISTPLKTKKEYYDTVTKLYHIVTCEVVMRLRDNLVVLIQTSVLARVVLNAVQISYTIKVF